MTKLKMFAAVAASTFALTGAAVTTAQAQPWHHDGYSDYRGDRDYHDYRGDNRLTTSYVDGLDWKIQNAAQYGRISWREAHELRSQLQTMKPIAWRVQTGQARGYEVERLQRFVNRVDSLTSGYAYNNRRWR